MQKNKFYIVNEMVFRTLNDIRLHVRKIKDSYIDNVNIDDKDFAFMRELLNHHESASHKIGCGVVSMYIKTVSVYKTNRCFWLVRSDMSETDFSFEKCLRNKPEPRLLKFKNACRTAISNDITKFKRNFFSGLNDSHSLCTITGERIAIDNSHVDHAYPYTFDWIVTEFIKLYKIDIGNIDLGGIGEDAVMRYSIKDLNLREGFIQFHNAHAVLRVISKTANLGIVKRYK